MNQWVRSSAEMAITSGLTSHLMYSNGFTGPLRSVEFYDTAGITMNCGSTSAPIEFTPRVINSWETNIMPTLPPVEFCDYCKAEYFASLFHPGCCGECGAPRHRQ